MPRAKKRSRSPARSRSSRSSSRSQSDRYESCVMKVKAKQSSACARSGYKAKGKKCYNPWAICTASVGRPPKKSSSRRARSLCSSHSYSWSPLARQARAKRSRSRSRSRSKSPKRQVKKLSCGCAHR